MGDRQPGVGHFIACAAAAIYPLIGIGVVGVGRGVVVPLLQYQHGAGRHERGHVGFVDVAVMPGGAPVGDLADLLGAAGFRIEDFQRGRVHAQMAVGLEAVDPDRMVEGVESLRHVIAVGAE